jgi:hypothetical protein
VPALIALNTLGFPQLMADWAQNTSRDALEISHAASLGWLDWQPIALGAFVIVHDVEKSLRDQDRTKPMLDSVRPFLLVPHEPRVAEVATTSGHSL